jgi:hypothetical protein
VRWFSSRARVSSRFPYRRPALLGLEILEDRSLLSSGIGVFAPATDAWSLRYAASAGAADLAFQFAGAATAGAGQSNGHHDGNGNTSLIPVVGDWNGDGKADIATFDPATATWSLRYEHSTGLADGGTFQFGTRNSIPVVGDWNGDGRSALPFLGANP